MRSWPGHVRSRPKFIVRSECEGAKPPTRGIFCSCTSARTHQEVAGRKRRTANSPALRLLLTAGRSPTRHKLYPWITRLIQARLCSPKPAAAAKRSLLGSTFCSTQTNVAIEGTTVAGRDTPRCRSDLFPAPAKLELLILRPPLPLTPLRQSRTANLRPHGAIGDRTPLSLIKSPSARCRGAQTPEFSLKRGLTFGMRPSCYLQIDPRGT
jgi:hypothetical protein